MAISKKDRDEMKKNKPMVDFDFGTPLPPKTDDFSFKDMSPQTSLDEIDTVEKKTLPKKRKGAVKKATKTSSHDSKPITRSPPALKEATPSPRSLLYGSALEFDPRQRSRGDPPRDRT